VTWHKFSSIAYGYREPSITIAADGHLVAALRGNIKILQSSAMFITHSYDGGKHWTNPVQVTHSHCHPGDLQCLSNGALMLTTAMRDKGKQRILGILSFDNGKSWSIDNPLMLNHKVYDHMDLGYPSTCEYAQGKIMTAFYVSPYAPKHFDLQSPLLYQYEKTEGHLLQYSLNDLMTKVL